MAKSKEIILVDQIESRILFFREQKVLLDADIAWLYGTTTKALNQAVKRNADRFPADFRFELSPDEKTMWSQIVTTSNN
jgi:hypothetical protein